MAHSLAIEVDTESPDLNRNREDKTPQTTVCELGGTTSALLEGEGFTGVRTWEANQSFPSPLYPKTWGKKWAKSHCLLTPNLAFCSNLLIQQGSEHHNERFSK